VTERQDLVRAWIANGHEVSGGQHGPGVVVIPRERPRPWADSPYPRPGWRDR
jgi:hypothetical protein